VRMSLSGEVFGMVDNWCVGIFFFFLENESFFIRCGSGHFFVCPL
jgi:hypothetical protein